jgi:dihydroorotate dehydrogenase electron transfer subunit
VTAAKPAIATAQKNRGTIFVEDAVLLETQAFPGDQCVLRLAAPKAARHALAGSFVHIQCDPGIPMRRPLSIMRADVDAGWIEILFKTLGSGLQALAAAETGNRISLIGPIGNGFDMHPEKSKPLLIGGGVGIPPMIFLVEQMLGASHEMDPTVLMGSEIPFPFAVAASAITTAWISADTNGCMPLLENWGVTSRLASLSGFDGCFRGYVTDLARLYLDSLAADELAQVEVFTCGPTPMLRAVADLATEYHLPCQVSLEEFMACAVGGCAGCTVEVRTTNGLAMQRVCVDGPVFDARSVFS